MTPHDHTRVVPGCYRCELGADEARDAERDDLLERVYDQAVLNRGYVTSALLDEIRAKGLGS